MKRKAIYIIMVSLLAAAAVSCTREIQAPDGEEATLTVTASLDAAMDDGTKASADGGLTNLAGQGYQLRYMMELWSPDGTTKEYKATPKYIDITDNMSMSVEYNLNLLAKKYKMVLWADIVKKNDDGTVTAYYIVPETDGLKAIVFPEESAFGSDEYDAFTAVADVNLTDGSKVIGANLKRPFAKIRIIDDWTESDPGTKYTTKLTFDSSVSIPWNIMHLPERSLPPLMALPGPRPAHLHSRTVPDSAFSPATFSSLKPVLTSKALNTALQL